MITAYLHLPYLSLFLKRTNRYDAVACTENGKEGQESCNINLTHTKRSYNAGVTPLAVSITSRGVCSITPAKQKNLTSLSVWTYNAPSHAKSLPSLYYLPCVSINSKHCMSTWLKGILSRVHKAGFKSILRLVPLDHVDQRETYHLTQFTMFDLPFKVKYQILCREVMI